MKKILVLGCCGAGKSTFSKKLQSILKLELIPHPKLQGAMIVIDPHSRLIKAVVGGYDLAQTGFLRATQALRQPGSAFKPIVYLAGLQAGMTPATRIKDAPFSIGKWRPKNYDGKFRGDHDAHRSVLAQASTADKQPQP